VIAMKVANEDMIYPCKADMVFPELKLRAFSAVDQKKPLMCT
jgi:hypothetical protein